MDNTLAAQWEKIGQQARQAQIAMRRLATNKKDNVLKQIAINLDQQRKFILQQNNLDVELAKQKHRTALIERLVLNDAKITQMIAGIEQIIAIKDPIGEISHLNYRPSGIQVGKMRVPLGVIGMIYEARPNVTIDAAILCFKSGNVCILRGGSEAIKSNIAIYQCITKALEECAVDAHVIQLLQQPQREFVKMMIASPEYIDVIIPRGGEALIQTIMEYAKIPVIKHLNGICHVYVDEFADLTMAKNIAINAKTRRYGVCNAMETLLVNHKIANQILPILADEYEQRKVELRGCDQTVQIIKCAVATEEDWHTEYLDAILSIKIVSDLDQAILHINHYGSAHSDAIVTDNINRARRFMSEVDSSSVFVNASTSFADGFEYGLGAEIGISTDKLHARGPVGLRELTSEKYVVFGQGEIRT